MNTKEITAIAIKFFAIWLLIHVILQVPSLLLVFNNIEGYVQQELPINLYVTVVGAFLLVGSIASYLLFRVSNSVLNSIPSSDDTGTENISQQFLLQLGGVYFIVSSFMLLLSAIISLRSQTTFEITNYLYSIGALFEMAVGLSMLIKAKVWAHWLNKLRGRA